MIGRTAVVVLGAIAGALVGLLLLSVLPPAQEEASSSPPPWQGGGREGGRDRTGYDGYLATAIPRDETTPARPNALLIFTHHPR